MQPFSQGTLSFFLTTTDRRQVVYRNMPTSEKYRNFLLTGAIQWDLKEWDEFVEELLTWIEIHPPPANLYLTQHPLLFGLPFCFLFFGRYTPSSKADGLFWKPSRGSIRKGKRLLRRYHYAQYNGTKMRRQVSFLEGNKEWCFVEYSAGPLEDKQLSDIHAPPHYDLSSLVMVIARRMCDPQNNASLVQEEVFQRMDVAAEGGTLPPIPQDFDPFNQRLQTENFAFQLSSGYQIDPSYLSIQPPPPLQKSESQMDPFMMDYPPMYNYSHEENMHIFIPRFCSWGSSFSSMGQRRKQNKNTPVSSVVVIPEMEDEDILDAVEPQEVRNVFSLDINTSQLIRTFFSEPPASELCVRLLHFLDYNAIWWKLCMKAWWASGSDCVRQNIPQRISAKEAKKLWKPIFLSSVKPPAPISVLLKKERDVSKAHDHSYWENEEEGAEPVNEKDQMRAYYKTMKSKPKGKGAVKDNRHKTDWMWEE
ncbi:hypothetical protein PROFUN_13074 [Planoprotostelium fungivorum]|uniref:NAC domain-containing protein n=1 Tax=Planoprotostelium fungivorum TaxID=1890364 RepID=A0A2P6N5H4_9EUKA|nr:hypothetical protein PROFUN_13074 [Planoprotostelium fungivorum]